MKACFGLLCLVLVAFLLEVAESRPERFPMPYNDDYELNPFRRSPRGRCIPTGSTCEPGSRIGCCVGHAICSTLDNKCFE